MEATLSRDALAVRVAAFHALRGGSAVSIAAIAAETSLSPERVERALVELAEMGLAQRDAGGRIAAAHGLSVRHTKHQLRLEAAQLHTWCAIDAVGIPPALGVDATAVTRCEHCGRRVTIEMPEGRVNAGLPYVLWCPGKVCSVVVEEFCPEANLFCDIDHLEAWRKGAGDPPGRPLSLEEAQSLGRKVWSDVAPR